jgi:hypothetical protein
LHKKCLKRTKGFPSGQRAEQQSVQKVKALGVGSGKFPGKGRQGEGLVPQDTHGRARRGSIEPIGFLEKVSTKQIMSQTGDGRNLTDRARRMGKNDRELCRAAEWNKRAGEYLECPQWARHIWPLSLLQKGYYG